jgi:V/A-type H+/Na+-transporting ATPase subunit F
MRIHVIGGRDLVLGFQLAGIPGDVVTSQAQADELIERAAADPRVAVIVVSRLVAQAAAERIQAVRVREGFPIVIQVPEPGEGPREADDLLRFVGDAMGLQV